MAFMNNEKTAEKTAKPNNAQGTVYDNSKQFGVFSNSVPFGFINLFMDREDFVKEHGDNEPEDIMFTKPREAKNGNALLTVLMHMHDGSTKAIGSYFPAKEVTLAGLRTAKEAGLLSYTLWSGIRDATEDEVNECF